MKTFSFILVFLSIDITLAQTPASPKVQAQEIVDFVPVKIGSQVWASQNLNVDHFTNGDIIPEAKTKKEWRYAKRHRQPAWCYYDNDSVNGKAFGKLYNYYALADPRGLVPLGWHVPTLDEWNQLNYFLGERTAAQKLKTTSGWIKNYSLKFYKGETNGTDEYGWHAAPGGIRNGYGLFYNKGVVSSWWVAPEKKEVGRIRWADITSAYWKIYLNFGLGAEGNGFYVRCLRD